MLAGAEPNKGLVVSDDLGAEGAPKMFVDVDEEFPKRPPPLVVGAAGGLVSTGAGFEPNNVDEAKGLEAAGVAADAESVFGAPKPKPVKAAAAGGGFASSVLEGPPNRAGIFGACVSASFVGSIGSEGLAPKSIGVCEAVTTGLPSNGVEVAGCACSVGLALNCPEV